LDVSMIVLLPAFIFTCAVAWRLAKFNIADNQSYSFKGVPSPAAGLLIASFPLIVFYEYFGIQTLFINKWFLYSVILIVSYLMVSNISFMAIKFTDFSVRNNLLKYILLAISLICLVILKWFAIPIIFVLYIILSLLSKHSSEAPKFS
jgi:CDP-diacylglycerol---serine O-phosphatidyltransferase